MIRQRLENWHASDTSNGFKPIRSSIDANNFDKFKSKTWFQWFYHWFSIALEFESYGIRISQSLDSKLPWFLWITTVIVTVKLISYNSYLTELHDIGLRIGVGSFKWKWKISFLIQKWQRSPRTHIWNLFCKKVLSTLFVLRTCTFLAGTRTKMYTWCGFQNPKVPEPKRVHFKFVHFKVYTSVQNPWNLSGQNPKWNEYKNYLSYL